MNETYNNFLIQTTRPKIYDSSNLLEGKVKKDLTIGQSLTVTMCCN